MNRFSNAWCINVCAKWCIAGLALMLVLNAHAAQRFATMGGYSVRGLLEGWVYAESRDDLAEFPSKGEITLDNQLIWTEDEVLSIQYHWGYPEKDPLSIAMLTLELPDRQECEAYYMLIDLRKEGQPIIIPRFGNCSSPKVHFKFGQVVSYFPEFGMSGDNKEVAYVYENGKLRKVSVTKEIRSGSWSKPIK